MSAISALPGYQTRLRQLHLHIRHADVAQKATLVVLLAAIAALLAMLAFSISARRLPAWCVALPLAAVVCSGWWFAMNRHKWSRFLRLRTFYERGVARLEDRWQGSGFGGEEYRMASHVYDQDLQVLGSGSLFELACTARTGLGRRRLAGYLLEPCDMTEATRRQDAVRELSNQTELRERVALLGKYDFAESRWEHFGGWLTSPAKPVTKLVRAVALVSSTALAWLVFAGFVTNLSWHALTPGFPLPLAASAGIGWYYRNRTNALNAAARRAGRELAVSREGIEFLAGLTFRSEKLKSLQARTGEGAAASVLRRLERMVSALAQCDKPEFELASHLLTLRTQICFAIEGWKFRHGGSVADWLDAWAEFEALASLSGYAWEHPEDVFPHFVNETASFAAIGLGHPLLPTDHCVRNDVLLDSECRFCIVSGSNMAGKSTLLRSIGLNAVLANAGAPVRAVSLRLTPLNLFTSLSIVDSVLEGKSKFLAEVERVRQTLDGARLGPVLFLIDEILSGTNSRDRRIASEAIVRALLGEGAIGLLSTRDLALTEIAELKGLAGRNLHMGSRAGGEALEFDYLVKPGATNETNALAIIRMIGVSV